jgi:hypothetical protein
MSRALWIVQALLALVFVFGGSFKLLAPADLLAQAVPLPELFVRFIGLCETLGAIGLILPTLLRIHPGLTPLAAAGLVIIMAGATLLGPLLMGDPSSALLPLVLGLLAAFVVYGRTQVAPVSVRQSRTRQLATG